MATLKRAAWGGIMAATIFWAAAAETASAAGAAADGQLWVYVGTYTRSGVSKGIYRMTLDLATGKLSAPELAAEVTNPSFLAFHPQKPLVYAVGEMSTFEGKKTGAVSALAVDPGSGRLTLLNQQSSCGVGPCHVAVDPSGRNALVANYGDGVAACLPILDDGRLGESHSSVKHEGSSVHPRQKGPHAHSVNLDPAGRFAFVADLGLDKVMIYRLDAAAHTITANDPPFGATPPGAGPRHFAFGPGAAQAYVINELASTITVFDFDATRGALTPIQTISTLPEGFTGNNTTAEVAVHPSGKFVYGSNRGHDSIAAFAVEPGGKLRLLGHTPSGGKTPRNFGIEPGGRYLLAAHQDSNNVVAFRIDPRSGALTPTGSEVEIGMPVCVKFRKPGI